MLDELKEVVGMVVACCCFLYIVIIYGAIIEPAWPLFTLVFAILWTVWGMKNPTLAAGGIAMYLASWAAVSTYGPYVAQAICGVGLLTWLVSPVVKMPGKGRLCTQL